MSKKKRIAYLLINFLNDRSRTQYNRTSFLIKKFSITLFVGKNTIFDEEITKECRIIRCPFDTNGVFIIGFPLWVVYYLIIHRNLKFTAIYSTYSAYSIIPGYIIKKYMGPKLIIDIWDHPERIIIKDNINFLEKTLKLIIITMLKKRVLNCADFIIVAIHRDGLKEYIYNRDNSLEITNGINPSYYYNGTNIKSNQFNLFYVGFVRYSESGYYLLETINALKNKIKNINLYIIGEIEKKNIIRFTNFINENKLNEHIHYLGKMEHTEVIKYMKKSDVCVCTLSKNIKYEYSYPIKILEYMAMGKAIVAPKLKGIKRILKNNTNSLLYDSNDIKEFQNAVYRLYTNTKLRNKIALEAKNNSYQYNWNFINNKIYENIKQLLVKSDDI